MKNWIYVLILLAGFPVGYYLSRVCKDEIKKWRGRLVALCVVGLLGAVGVGFSSFAYKFPIIMALFFMVIVFLVGVWRGW